MSLLMDTETNRFWARVDFLATGEIALHIPEEFELPIRVLVSRGGRSTEYEPSNSEKPNNCDTCGTPRHLCEYCIEEDRMWTPKTEPQRGYMWTCPKCGTENHSDFKKCPCCGYTPQTEERSE